MQVTGGGFDQCYNAQAAVAAGSLLVVATDVVQAPNDKQQVEPMLEKIEALPAELGKVENLLADTVRKGRRRTGDRDGPPTASSAAELAIRGDALGAEGSAVRRGDGPQAEDARRPCALRPAQTDAGTGVRHHQVRARIPSTFTARARECSRRVESRDHGLESESDVRPRHGMSSARRLAQKAGAARKALSRRRMARPQRPGSRSAHVNDALGPRFDSLPPDAIKFSPTGR